MQSKPPLQLTFTAQHCGEHIEKAVLRLITDLSLKETIKCTETATENAAFIYQRHTHSHIVKSFIRALRVYLLFFDATIPVKAVIQLRIN